jgi:hypothetical protein
MNTGDKRATHLTRKCCCTGFRNSRGGSRRRIIGKANLGDRLRVQHLQREEPASNFANELSVAVGAESDNFVPPITVPSSVLVFHVT